MLLMALAWRPKLSGGGGFARWLRGWGQGGGRNNQRNSRSSSLRCWFRRFRVHLDRLGVEHHFRSFASLQWCANRALRWVTLAAVPESLRERLVGLLLHLIFFHVAA